MKKGRWSVIIFALAFICLQAKAQPFAWKSTLDTVSQSGFYTIPLSAEWLAYLKTDLSDLRIRDGQNRPVPFLIKPQDRERSSGFINFAILKNTTDSAATTLELDAGTYSGTNRLYLMMGNTAVERYASLSGSNNRRQWFIVDEKLLLENNSGDGNDDFAQLLYLPFIRYRYLKLRIDNRGTDPLFVSGAGVYADTDLKKYADVPVQPESSYRQKDSNDGYTYVWIHNKQPYPVEKIILKLSGPKFYVREIKVHSQVNQRKVTVLATGDILSGEEAVVRVQPYKIADRLLTIKNGENPALTVDAVSTQCSRRQLIAYLEKGRSYTLVGGNPSVTAPDYDLANFQDSVPPHTTELAHRTILPNDGLEQRPASKQRWWIWLSVVVMLAVLSGLTFRLLGEVKKQKE